MANVASQEENESNYVMMVMTLAVKLFFRPRRSAIHIFLCFLFLYIL